LKELVALPESDIAWVERYRDCAARLQSLYREHIRSEDEILTRLARRSLNDAELAAISAEMRERRAS